MGTIFDEIDRGMNTAQMQQAIAAAQQGQQTFENPPAGTYHVAIRTMELGTSKAGKPMLKVSLRILDEGQYKNRLIWHNLVCYGTRNDAFMISKVLEFLTSLRAYDATGYVPVTFTSYGALMGLVTYIKQCIDIAGLVYTVQHDPDSFDRVTVKEVHFPQAQQ